MYEWFNAYILQQPWLKLDLSYPMRIWPLRPLCLLLIFFEQIFAQKMLRSALVRVAFQKIQQVIGFKFKSSQAIYFIMRGFGFSLKYSKFNPLLSWYWAPISEGSM